MGTGSLEQGPQQSSKWARVKAGKAEDLCGCCRGAKHSTHHPWEAGKAPLASIPSAWCQQRRAEQEAAVALQACVPASSDSPEGSRVQQEMRNGNAAWCAQETAAGTAVASQCPANSHSSLLHITDKPGGVMQGHRGTPSPLRQQQQGPDTNRTVQSSSPHHGQHRWTQAPTGNTRAGGSLSFHPARSSIPLLTPNPLNPAALPTSPLAAADHIQGLTLPCPLPDTPQI